MVLIGGGIGPREFIETLVLWPDRFGFEAVCANVACEAVSARSKSCDNPRLWEDELGSDLTEFERANREDILFVLLFNGEAMMAAVASWVLPTHSLGRRVYSSSVSGDVRVVWTVPLFLLW